MGGLGSGRWNKQHKTVDDCLLLDINALSASGCLQPGCSSTCQWIFGADSSNIAPFAGTVVASVSLYVEERDGVEQLRLSWRSPASLPVGNSPVGTTDAGTSAGAGEGYRSREDMTEIIPIVRMPVRLGGDRPYFLCPGDGCGRRLAKLFLAHHRFLCRQCSGIVHASPYEPAWVRTHRHANKLRARLTRAGIAVAATSIPKKPKWMRVPTYKRLLDELLAAEIAADEACTARLQKIADQLETRARTRFIL
jgi:hypothetical protein